MNLKDIREYIENNYFLYSNKVQRRITSDQIINTILKGTKRKVEYDERSDGKFEKFTFHWRNWYVVVKNTDRPFIITAGRLDVND